MPVYVVIVPTDEMCDNFGVSKGLRVKMNRVDDSFNIKN